MIKWMCDILSAYKDCFIVVIVYPFISVWDEWDGPAGGTFKPIICCCWLWKRCSLRSSFCAVQEQFVSLFTLEPMQLLIIICLETPHSNRHPQGMLYCCIVDDNIPAKTGSRYTVSSHVKLCCCFLFHWIFTKDFSVLKICWYDYYWRSSDEWHVEILT